MNALKKNPQREYFEEIQGSIIWGDFDFAPIQNEQRQSFYLGSQKGYEICGSGVFTFLIIWGYFFLTLSASAQPLSLEEMRRIRMGKFIFSHPLEGLTDIDLDE